MTLLLLATIILSAAAIRHSGHQELLVIASLLFPISLVETKLAFSFLSRKSDA
jgi:hypothetical protein